VLGPDVEEAGPLRSVEPFVGVTAVVVGSQCLDAHRHVAGHVGSVDDRDDAEGTSAGEDLLQRQEQAGRGRDVADVDRARALAGGGEERIDDLARVADRQRDRRPDVERPSAAAHPLPRQVAGAVLEVGGKNLVFGAESERASGEIDAGRRVLDEREILRGAADVRGECRPCVVEQGGQAAVDEFDGLGLEFALPDLIALEDRPRAGAERSVVEEGDLGVEEELGSKFLGGGGSHGC
jgi:hypothetical protein